MAAAFKFAFWRATQAAMEIPALWHVPNFRLTGSIAFLASWMLPLGPIPGLCILQNSKEMLAPLFEPSCVRGAAALKEPAQCTGRAAKLTAARPIFPSDVNEGLRCYPLFQQWTSCSL